MTNNLNIVVYCTAYCPYCTMAKRLLDSKGLKYSSIDIGNDQALWKEMEEKSGRNTVPQIFIGNTHVGGFDDLSAADNSGKLDKILAEEA